MKRVLLVHINPMQRYCGFADDDDPRNMRSHNPKDLVHERYNFQVAPNGRVYGAWCEGKVKLGNIDPTIPAKAKRIDNVLVIFWATFTGRGQRVAGWYADATVWANIKQNAATDRDQNAYIAEASSSVLLSAAENIKVPLASGHNGRYGVGNHYGHWYLFERGKRKIEPWLDQLLKKIESHKSLVQHARPDLQDEDRFAEEATVQFDREQGYLSDSRLRQVIEDYAVTKAINVFQTRGYRLVRKVGKPFDLLFSKNETEMFVEVKGTQTDGRRIFLTPNEVACSRIRHPNYCLFVLHSIRISDPRNPVPHGGDVMVKMAFRPSEQRLRAITYSYLFETDNE